jgi:hypothetical protein
MSFFSGLLYYFLILFGLILIPIAINLKSFSMGLPFVPRYYTTIADYLINIIILSLFGCASVLKVQQDPSQWIGNLIFCGIMLSVSYNLIGIGPKFIAATGIFGYSVGSLMFSLSLF